MSFHVPHASGMSAEPRRVRNIPLGANRLFRFRQRSKGRGSMPLVMISTADGL